MTTRTLLLTSWMAPQRVISWQRAMTLLVLGKAEVLEAYDDVVTTTSVTWPTPSVLRLIRGVPSPFQRRIRFSRVNVYARDRYRCQYCGQRFAATALTYDHVVPRARGGPTSWKNIVSACTPCNGRKGNRTPTEAGMPLRTAPYEPRSLPPRSQLGVQSGVPASWTRYGVADIERVA